MPIPSQKIGETFSKDATRVRSLLRVSNIPFKMPDDHPATTVVDNYRLVSVQEDNATKKLYAVLGWNSCLCKKIMQQKNFMRCLAGIKKMALLSSIQEF